MLSAPSPSSSQSAKTTRRQHLQHLAALALTVSIPFPSPASAAPSSRQVMNGVLSGYGLPSLPDVQGFSPLLEQYGSLVVQFQYPSAWIIAHNSPPAADDSGLTQAYVRAARTLMEGRNSSLTVGDYRKAEGLSLFVSRLPSGKDIHTVSSEFIAELVTPGDATGNTPNVRVVRDVMDTEGYRIVDTRYESITASGYSVARRGRTRLTVLSDGKLYALTGACSDIRWKKIGDALTTAIESFSAFRV